MTDLLHMKRENLVAIGIVIILGMMVIPIPPFLLDIFLSLSISISIVVLLTSVYIRKPLDFSVFPSLLLILTLYRLSLNVASTRLILLRGSEGIDAAGGVIKSFGSFVVGGNYVVGFTIFLILIVINFVVITKGAGRIAEVAARFILDSMPGKQMAIDADLNAGIINEAEARRRRDLISQEADFYGAMDGASKFVRGDAIAGLIITGINIIVGFIIGTAQKGMPISEAARTYTVLTIGDGLVSQMPSLLVSTAAGIVVSRAGAATDFGDEITKQVLINPRSLAAASGVVFVLGLVPGLPHISFFLFSVALGALAYVISRSPVEEAEEKEDEKIVEDPSIEVLTEIEPLTFEIGYGLIPLVESDESELLGRIKSMRKQIGTELGFVIPPIHIKDNLQLRPHEYRLLLRDVEIARGEVMMGYWLAVPSDKAESIDGIPTKEPAFELPAFWIDERGVENARTKGYMVVDIPTAIATHLTEVIKRHAWELLTRTEVQGLLDGVSKRYPKLVDELIPSQLTLGNVQRILQNLLREKVPIKDTVTILETLIDHSVSTKDVELLTEFVRQALSRVITKQYTAPDGSLYVMTLDPRFERVLLEAKEGGSPVDADVVSRLVRAIERSFTADTFRGSYPLILCSSQVRRFLRKITERFIPSVVILSTAEVTPSVKLYIQGVVAYED